MAPSTSMAVFCTFLFVIGWSALGWACLCKLDSPEANYCAADWVAHVQVVKRQDGVRMPAGIVDRQHSAENARHEMKYLQMFKISKSMKLVSQGQTGAKNEAQMMVVLPIHVYTAMEDTACGILLEPGHEYLLAGQYVNGTMLTWLCRQILLEDLKESRKHDILEWAEVPEKIKQQLAKQEFDPVCARMEQEAAKGDSNNNNKQAAQPPKKL